MEEYRHKSFVEWYYKSAVLSETDDYIRCTLTKIVCTI